MRRQGNMLKVQSPGLWKTSFYEAVVLLLALLVLLMLPQLGDLLR